MNRQLKEKIMESISSVLPITAIVFIISIFIIPISLGTFMLFLVGALLLIIGMGLFTLGADMAMRPMGEGMGVHFTKTKKLTLVILLTFFLGFIVTIAEPDLQVLAKQVSAMPDIVLVSIVAAGVGVFLVIAILRILFRIKLSYILMGFYLLIFIIAFFVPPDFIPVAFDSGGVTTGSITVPFIMAFGLGFASIRGDKDSQDDSFGLAAIASTGPILAVLVLGIYYKPTTTSYNSVTIPDVITTRDVAREFSAELPASMNEVLLALVPILFFFFIFQFVTKRYRRREIYRISVGYLYTFVGLVLFLSGVNVGFIPVGSLIGAGIANSDFRWMLIPISMLIGYFIVAAEPAVHVLNKQVEEVSEGAITQKIMNTALSTGVSISLGISMLRILLGIPIMWFLLPGYFIALGLAFFVPKMFTGIAFDSGGIASGSMTSTFLLPFAMGVCESVGGNIMTDAFGIIAIVAMTPMITIQIMGLIYTIKEKQATKKRLTDLPCEYTDDIIEY